MSAPRVDPGGPLVAVCTGHRCAALRRLAGTADGVDRLAEVVRGTPGAVLVTAACLGRCDRAALAGLARRAPGTGQAGPAVWLAEVQSPERTDGLVAWLRAGGPTGSTDQDDPPALHRLPACLRPAVTGIGPPIQLTSG